MGNAYRSELNNNAISLKTLSILATTDFSTAVANNRGGAFTITLPETANNFDALLIKVWSYGFGIFYVIITHTGSFKICDNYPMYNRAIYYYILDDSYVIQFDKCNSTTTTQTNSYIHPLEIYGINLADILPFSN